jgi:single-stranded-DNA-specific exonuclease
VAETLVRRGFTEVEAARAFLDPSRYQPAPPSDLPNLTEAVARVVAAIRTHERICVWGDFDVDGQTATTILVSTLTDLGGDVFFHIPHRETESHGVNLPSLERVIDRGAKLVVTCDTGITAHEAIAYARERGTDVVVTDHHDLPAALPAAWALVNPKMLPESHALRELPGVGCACKLAEALYSQFNRPKEVDEYLDLVALGIVADVAVQTGDTRYLLQRGLQELRRNRRLGLRAIVETVDLDPERLTETHIGFVLAPRLNALGRLADATVAVEFLTTRDLKRARILAAELEGLNARRKLLSDQVTQAAQEQLDHDPSLLSHSALVLSHPSWPPGVLGIAAGRLAERHGRPVVLVATPPGEPAIGSARSVEGCNITAAIAAHKEMVSRFGGHPMAAGLSIEPERIPEFRQALSRTVEEMLGERAEERPLPIAGHLALGDLSLELVEQLERLAPFGPGNPPLTLASTGLRVTSHTALGRTGEHRRLTVEDEDGRAETVIWWQGGGLMPPEGRFDLAYVVRATDFRGQREVQVEWVDARPIEETAIGLSKRLEDVKVVDFRQAADRRVLLDRLRAQENLIVWSEAEARAELSGRDRRELRPSRALAIWTTPPGQAELHEALKKVSPETVYLFGIDPGLGQRNSFLERLFGLAKHAMMTGDGWVQVSMLAAATAQREATVRAGIAWFVAHGDLALVEEEGERVCLAEGGQKATDNLPRAAARLRGLLEETVAFRDYFSRADKETLVGT